MFTVLYGKQQLEKNWHVLIPEILYVLIICSLKYFLLKIFRAFNFCSLWWQWKFFNDKNCPNYNIYTTVLLYSYLYWLIFGPFKHVWIVKLGLSLSLSAGESIQLLKRFFPNCDVDLIEQVLRSAHSEPKAVKQLLALGYPLKKIPMPRLAWGPKNELGKKKEKKSIRVVIH